MTMIKNILLLMIYILHYLKDPKLSELLYFLILGNAGFVSSTVVWGLGIYPKP